MDLLCCGLEVSSELTAERRLIFDFSGHKIELLRPQKDRASPPGGGEELTLIVSRRD